MSNITSRFDVVDASITNWMARHGLPLLRISLGIVFLWFGALKFFPGLSPASDLAARTIEMLSFGTVPANLYDSAATDVALYRKVLYHNNGHRPSNAS